jgi:type II secretion system protein N
MAIINDLNRKWIKWIGYPLFSLTMFLLFFYLTFPYDKLKTRIEELAGASGDIELSIEDLGPSPLFGLSAEGVLLKIKPKESRAPISSPQFGLGAPPAASGAAAAEPPQKKKPLRLILDEVVLKTSLFSLLLGKTDVSFEITALDGSLEGQYTEEKKKGWAFELEAQHLDLSRLPELQEMVGLPFAGKVSSKVDLKVPRNQFSEASGTVSLELTDCVVGDGKAKLKVPGNPLLAMGITLPRVRLGTLGGQVKIEKGEALFENVSATSPDVQMKLEGGISLRNPLGFSQTQAYLTFKISPELKKRDPKFDLLENGLATAKRSDGFFGMRIEGFLKSPRFNPSQMGLPERNRMGGGGIRGDSRSLKPSAPRLALSL